MQLVNTHVHQCNKMLFSAVAEKAQSYQLELGSRIRDLVWVCEFGGEVGPRCTRLSDGPRPPFGHSKFGSEIRGYGNVLSACIGRDAGRLIAGYPVIRSVVSSSPTHRQSTEIKNLRILTN